MTRASARALIALLAIIGMVLAGCGSSDSDADAPQESQSAEAGGAEEATGENDEGDATDKGDADEDKADKHDNNRLIAAGKTAESKLPDGTVIEIESENDGANWEVEVAFPSGVRKKLITSSDGESIERGPRGFRQDGHSKAKWRKRVKNVTVDYAEAYDKIVTARDGTVTELELDEEDGVLVWEADVKAGGTEYEVSIDARSGKVVENEKD